MQEQEDNVLKTILIIQKQSKNLVKKMVINN